MLGQGGTVSHPHATFVDELRHLSLCMRDVVGPLEQVRDIFVESAAAQATLGKQPTRPTVNLQQFTICAMDAAEHAIDLYASLHRPTGIRSLTLCSGVPKVSQGEAVRLLVDDRKRVKGYFRSLLVEMGIPVTSWYSTGYRPSQGPLSLPAWSDSCGCDC